MLVRLPSSVWLIPPIFVPKHIAGDEYLENRDFADKSLAQCKERPSFIMSTIREDDIGEDRKAHSVNYPEE